MTWLDYIILGVILTSVAISVMRGFLQEALSLATWLSAFFVGFQFSDDLAFVFTTWVQSNSFRHIIAFMILFAGTLIMGSICSYVVTRLVQKTKFGGTDKVLGISFGLLRGVLVVSALLMAGNLTTLTSSPAWGGSVFVMQFQPVVTWMQAYLPADIHKPLEKTKQA